MLRNKLASLSFLGSFKFDFLDSFNLYLYLETKGVLVRQLTVIVMAIIDSNIHQSHN